MSKRTCAKCKKSKALSEYQRSGYFDDGSIRYRGKCKACLSGPAKKAAAKKPPKPEPRPVEPMELVRLHRAEYRAARLQEQNRKLTKALHLADKRAGLMDSLRSYRPAPIKASQGRGKQSREACALLLCSDWHAEEEVRPEKVNGLNKYTLEIAHQRIQNLKEGFLWKLEANRATQSTRGHRIDQAVVWLGGDLITGHIHEENLEACQLSPTKATRWLKRRIIDFLEDIAARSGLKRIQVPCSFGNHGRTTKKRRIATAADHSFEWLMYQDLADWFRKHPVIDVFAPEDKLIQHEILGYRCRFTHGDEISGGGMGGPAGPFKKACMGWDTSWRADYTFAGHLHQLWWTKDGIVNGSLIGWNPYAIEIKARFEHPAQAMGLIDSKYGLNQVSAIRVG